VRLHDVSYFSLGSSSCGWIRAVQQLVYQAKLELQQRERQGNKVRSRASPNCLSTGQTQTQDKLPGRKTLHLSTSANRVTHYSAGSRALKATHLLLLLQRHKAPLGGVQLAQQPRRRRLPGAAVPRKEGHHSRV
jgi:hypothetical protein